MNWDLRRAGSGGDFDPDDGLVDWMQTASKFNGRKRNPDTHRFGYFSEAEADRLITEQSATADLEKRRELVQQANRITSDKVACAFLFHPANILIPPQGCELPGGEPHSGPGRSRPGDGGLA